MNYIKNTYRLTGKDLASKEKATARRNLMFSHYFIIALLSSVLITSCKKFVEVSTPDSRIVSKAVFEKDETATAAVVGIYHKMFDLSNFSSGSPESVTVVAGLSADEFETHSSLETSLIEFYENEVSEINGTDLSLWSSAYNTIYMANAVIEGLNASTGVTSTLKTQLIGEAKFIRAFCHFYLINLYGDVPLVTTTDYKINSLASRTSKEQVYQQIITDLTDARNALPIDYSFSLNERTRPNKWAATALLARVYLYEGDWVNAESSATEVIGQSTTYELLNDLEAVFLANSKEAIWQISPVGLGNTLEGNTFILTSDPTSLSLDTNFIHAFEATDHRFNNWVGVFDNGTDVFYYPNKYKVQLSGDAPTEYSMVLRLAEQYLIRAEARAQQDKLIGANSAEEDINAIRTRAGLPNTTSNTKPDLLDAIMRERRVEFFAEWGHRWFDLKRTGSATMVLSPIKVNWQSTDVLYPIPQQELSKDPNLAQNDGY